MKIQQGVIIIADISGYTNFVKMHSISILHAEWVLSELMRAIAKAFSSPVVLNKLEGDAAMFFAPVSTGKEAQTINKITQQAIASFYAFKQTRDSLLNSNICFCGACLGMQSLSIKMVLFLGQVVEKKLLGKNELSGDDVIIAHRLLKNSIQSHEYFLMNTNYYQYAKESLHTDATTLKEQIEGFGEVSLLYIDGKELEQNIPKPKRSILQGIMQIFRIQSFMIRRGTGILKKGSFTHLPVKKENTTDENNESR